MSDVTKPKRSRYDSQKHHEDTVANFLLERDMHVCTLALVQVGY